MFGSRYILWFVGTLLILDAVVLTSGFNFDWLTGGSNKNKTKKGGGGFWNLFKSNNEDDEDEKEEIQYLLRDRKEQDWVDIPRNGTVPSIWNKDGDVKIIIHGFSTNVLAQPKTIMKEQNVYDIGTAYGRHNSTVNVVLVDWTKLATKEQLNYEEAVEGVAQAGKDVADFVLNLTKSEHIKDLKRVHLIGLSLGAHVAGVASNALQKEKKDTKVGRITGLDPNGPEFDDEGGKKLKNDTAALSKDDAEFVDVIHCNMGTADDYNDAVVKGRYGSAVKLGHADFYPNGGETQKSCNLADENPGKACSQRKCADYYAKSINTKFLGCLCDNWEEFKDGKCNCTIENGGNYMGDPCSTSAYGKHFLTIP